MGSNAALNTSAYLLTSPIGPRCETGQTNFSQGNGQPTKSILQSDGQNYGGVHHAPTNQFQSPKHGGSPYSTTNSLGVSNHMVGANQRSPMGMPALSSDSQGRDSHQHHPHQQYSQFAPNPPAPVMMMAQPGYGPAPKHFTGNNAAAQHLANLVRYSSYWRLAPNLAFLIASDVEFQPVQPAGHAELLHDLREPKHARRQPKLRRRRVARRLDGRPEKGRVAAEPPATGDVSFSQHELSKCRHGRPHGGTSAGASRAPTGEAHDAHTRLEGVFVCALSPLPGPRARPLSPKPARSQALRQPKRFGPVHLRAMQLHGAIAADSSGESAEPSAEDGSPAAVLL